MFNKLVVTTAISCLLISAAVAQAPAPATPSTPPSAAAPAAAGANPVTSQKPDQWLASKFKGTEVLGSDNQKVGSVSDILFDKDGKIHAYVISSGGMLGIGAKEVALSPNSFQVVKGDDGSADKLKIPMSQDEVKSASDFQRYTPPETTGAGTRSAPGQGMAPPRTRTAPSQ